jgi:hypothetical protein
MPKFEKGSIEMKNYMAELQAKRGTNKRPISTHKQVSKEHIQNIVNEALEKYYMVSTPVVEIPEKLVTIKNGKAKIIDTLTKAGNLKKVDGENVIKLESGDNLNVKSNGTKFNADEILKTIPSQTIVHKTVQKTQRSQMKPTTKDYNDGVIDVKNENIPIQKILHKTVQQMTRPKIQPTTKDYNDVIDVKNENIPIQKILHNPQSKTIKRASIEPYTDIIEVGNVDIKPLKKTTMSTQKITKTKPKK